jgi:hypothetical protein
MEKLCIDRAAKRMVRLFGAQAATFSNRRADEFLDLGIIDRFSIWASIAEATKQCTHIAKQAGGSTANRERP